MFDNCRVPAQNRVGSENNGVAIVMSGLNIERAFLALGIICECQRCLDLSVEYAAQRKQFGQPIGSCQRGQAHLAEMYTETEASRQLCYKALWACNDLQLGGGRGDIHMLTAAALLKAGQTNMLVADKGVQIFGGSGSIWHTEINSHCRSAKVTTIGGGSEDIRKVIIARSCCERSQPEATARRWYGHLPPE